MHRWPPLPIEPVLLRVEVPRGGRSKRGRAGELELWSPLGSPFNYGSAVGQLAPDGDEIDAILFGPRLEAGALRRLPVLGQARFLDAGRPDPKWICALGELPRGADLQLRAFFHLYGLAKRLTGRGPAGLMGLEWRM